MTSSEEIMSESFSNFGVPCWVLVICSSLCAIFLKMVLETSMWMRKMKERGRSRVMVIWLKTFLHENMIFEDSLQHPKNPRNCMSSCSLSMVFG